MTRALARIPDFAGVALVDILANGVATLIIVIVLSIAARLEREHRHTEQADEVAAVMSHKFSTSLVLNSLAASPPARLHDYELSPLDQVLDPEVLPIIELHDGFVREFYSGTVWTRHALLAEENALGVWLAGFTEQQRQRLRIDVYEIDQFYVTMSILREHGIVGRHWHFVPERVTLAEARRCPPGIPARYCAGGLAENAPVDLPELAAAGQGKGSGGPDWPPPGFATGEGRGFGGAGDTPGPMPGGVVPGFAGVGPSGGLGGASPGAAEAAQRGSGFGRGQGLDSDAAAGLGSFPNARTGQERRSAGHAGDWLGRSIDEERVQFRVALPESVRRELEWAPRSSQGSRLETIIGTMLAYLRDLQDTLDAGLSPSARIAGFAENFRNALQSPPPLTEEERRIAYDVARELAFLHSRSGGLPPRRDSLAVRPVRLEPDEDAALIVAPNRPLEAVGLGRNVARGDQVEFPEAALPRFGLNAYPGIWQGLEVTIEPHAVLLMPPSSVPGRLGWRAVGYLAPTLDDFIFGFVFAGLDAEGRLQVQADANRVRFGGRRLLTEYRRSWFGARGWLVSLYAALVLGILLLALGRRFLIGRAV